MANLSGSTVSYDSGKFKLAGTYEYSDGAIVFQAKLDVTDKFKKAHKFAIRWSTDGVNYETATTSATKNADHTFAQRSVNGRTLYVGVKAGNSSWSSKTVTIASTQAPDTITASFENDACINVKVSGSSYVERPASKITIERSNNLLNGWSSIVEFTDGLSGSTYSFEYEDNDVDVGNRYYYRAKAYNSISGDSSYVTCGPVYTSASSSSISDVTTTQSGNSVIVSWTCNLADIQSGVVTSFAVQRSSGGTYTTIGTVLAEKGKSSYTYTDTVSNGGSYDYQVTPNGTGGEASGGSSGGTTITTPPNSPSSVSAYRNSSDNIVITVRGSSNNAESVVIERSIDGGDYSVVTTLDYAASVTHTDTGATASDSIIYRAKYTNSDGSSGYVTSASVQVKQKPNPPYLKTPYNGTPIDMAQNTVRLVWEHRPKDGSPQQAANLQYKVGSGSWTTISNITTNTYYDLSLQSFSANDVITWHVKTKGSHDDYSEYSDSYTMTLLTRPTLEFTEPDNAEVITSLPLVMEWTYNDACGTLQELKVDIVKSKEIVKTINVDVGAGTSGTYTYSLKGVLLDNNTVYGLKAYALSSSGLSAEDNISVAIQYEEVAIAGGLLPSVVNDPETGYAYITCMRDVTDGATPVAIAEAYLYRVHDNETVYIAPVYEGVQILDKLAPINVEYEYKLQLLTTGGAVSIVSVTVKNESQYWFCYFGDEIARAVWNPTGTVNLDRPQRTEVRYSGRRFPVSYDQDALEETYSFSTVLMEREELNRFRKMMQNGGQGIWKSGDGDAYTANFVFDYSSDFKSLQPMWNCSLKVTRIDGGE